MRVSGIYKITNLANGKFYVGQSRDIFTRWKSHTMSVTEESNESVIRMAFAKYGLKKQVSKEGIFDNFKFEILELCGEDNLLEREYYFISKLNPEYNVQLMGVNSIFSKRDIQKSNFFIQYHSFEKMGYFPGETKEDFTTEFVDYGIYSRKRVAVNMLGASVVLILGGKPENCKHNRYYIWSELIIEDVMFDKEIDTYVLQGILNLPNQPIDITDIDGFNEFRMKCGNFAYGLQSMKNKPFFFDVIQPLISNNQIKKHLPYGEWIDNFLEKQDEIYTS